VSPYRIKARQIIASIVRANIGLSRSELLVLIDAAYPFGERKYWPYKQWLVERAAYLEAASSVPSRDEAAVCLVAHDLVELGRVDEARKLMDDQAPNRLKRPCPACGVRAGTECREPRADNLPFAWRGLDPGIPRIVPHEARLTGGGSGPLFGGRE
jgi:hypothetical protein